MISRAEEEKQGLGQRGPVAPVAIELLFFDGCPSHEAFLPPLRALLREAGLDEHVSLLHVGSPRQRKPSAFWAHPRSTRRQRRRAGRRQTHRLRPASAPGARGGAGQSHQPACFPAPRRAGGVRAGGRGASRTQSRAPSAKTSRGCGRWAQSARPPRRPSRTATATDLTSCIRVACSSVGKTGDVRPSLEAFARCAAHSILIERRKTAAVGRLTLPGAVRRRPYRARGALSRVPP